MKKPDDIVKHEADKALALERQFADKLQELNQVQAQINATWDNVKDAMVKHKVKSLKGDFGSITVAERVSYMVNEAELPEQYFKQAPDLKKIGSDYSLTGEVPQGVTPRTTIFLTKRLK